LGGLVGLALRNVSACPMELNLRPESVIRREREARQRPALVLAALCLLAGLAAAWLYFDHAATITTQVVEALEPQVRTLQSFESQLKAVRAEAKAQEITASPLLEAVRERDYWAEILNDFNSRLPPEFVWVTAFQPDVRNRPLPADAPPRPKNTPEPPPVQEAIVEVQGLYLLNPRDTAVVDEFINKLNESDYYTVDASPPHVREVPNDLEWAYRYSFALVLKDPIAFTATTTQRKNP
jgi:Tfp pilus assembly protein PilN